MAIDLKAATDNLYKTFSRYPFRSEMEGCPCCVSDDHRRQLCSKSLERLTSDDLSLFAYKAMTTWGEVPDFKHFLPRMFELLATTDFNVDTFVVLGKLEDADWKNWKQDEQEAVRTFLLAWWTHAVAHKGCFDSEAFLEINLRIEDVQALLDLWVLSFDDNSFSNFVTFIHEDLHSAINKAGRYKNLREGDPDRILDWVKRRKSVLERGFFAFENKEPEFAAEISNALYILDRL